MKLALLFSAVISLLGGITFFAITGSVLLLVLPVVVNFAGLGIVAGAAKLFITVEPEDDEEYSAYHSAHSL